MNIISKLIIFPFLIAMVVASCAKSDNPYEPVDTFEGGKLHTSATGAFYIAELHGTFHQMGRQYGLLLKPQLAEFYQEVITDYLIQEKEVPYEELLLMGKDNYSAYPVIFRDYYDGMAETSGLTTDQVMILSNVLLALYETGCSSLSAWGDYTPCEKTVTGRNLDLVAPGIRRFAKYYQVVVWNPTGYPASVASIDLMGGLFYQTAINNKGVFLELQNGQNCDTSNPVGRENTNNILLESLFRNTSGKEVDQWFNTTLPEVGLIMNGSYPDHATIYEWATFRVVPRNGQGLLSATNDFIDSSWHQYPIFFYDTTNEGIGYTCTRRINLMKLGEQNKGLITPQIMMDIFDKTIPEGGATFPDEGLISTIYSVVVQPSELKIWLKVRGYSGWEEIDLKNYFSR
ncbi:MAG: hypothetical protein JXA23_02205 [Bacteroidales bacterium]|nr:hypothetical protein [Bacteroidales bacterium]